jgi:hypothetical protein
MSSSDQAKSHEAHEQNGVFVTAVGLAIALCILCCGLILLIPTQSITVDTVYQGF